MNMQNKTIALTGSTGFIGQHIIHEALSLGANINALTRRPQQPVDGVKWVLGDLHNQAALNELVEGVDAVIHTAGLVKALNFDQFAQINVEGSANLAQAILDANSAKTIHTVHFSSMAAREPELSHYARSKNLSEQAMQALLYKNPKTPLTILRPPAVYGPKDTELLPVIKNMQAGILTIPASKKNRFAMIYATDLVHAALSVLGQEATNKQVYELDDGCEQGYEMEELGHIAAKIFDRPIRPIVINKWLLSLAGFVGSAIATISRTPQMLTHLKVNELAHPNWKATNNRLNNSPFWQAQVDLEQGLEKTISWYKNEKILKP